MSISPPKLIAPPEGSSNTVPQVQFTWSVVPGAACYELVLSSNPSFTSVAEHIKPLISPIRMFVSVGVWYVRVRAVLPNSVYSEWSPVTMFTRGPILPPTLLTPAAGSSVQNPVALSWSNVPGVYKYRLSLGSSVTGPWEATEVMGSKKEVVLPVGLHFWKVDAFDGERWSHAPTSLSFSRIPLPPPECVSPAVADELPIGVVPFTWKEVIGAVCYIVEVSDKKSFASSIVVPGVKGLSCSVVLPRGDWYWRVKAWDGLNDGVVSKAIKFKRLPPVVPG